MTGKCFNLACLMLAILCLNACTADTAPETFPVVPQQESQMLPPPAELDGLHSPSNLTRDVTLGKDIYVKSGNAVELPGGELKMDAMAKERCWAIWQIPDQPEYLDSVFFDILSPEGEGCYIGLADYSTGRWQFSGPYTDQTTLPFPSDWQVSPAGYHYFAVMTQDGASVELAQLHAYFQDGWQQLTIHDGMQIQSLSIASIGNRPAILWQELGDPKLSYAISSTADGQAPGNWTQIGIGFGPGGASGVDLQEINGRPAFSFSYSDFENSIVLGYALSNNSTGSSPGNWSYFLLDQQSGIGYYNSLAMINGRPAITYAYLSGLNELWYSRSSDLHGGQITDWSAPVRIDHDGSAEIGVDCSLAEIDGKPAVAYHADNGLRYAWSSDVTGESEGHWNVRIVDPDSASTVGRYASLALIAGKPAIAYYDQLHADLKYAWSETAQGQAFSDWNRIEISGPPVAGQYVSLLELAENPALCYYTVGSLRNLIFDEAITPQGAVPEDWGPFITVDDHVDIDPPDVGQFCDMAVVNGNPVIAYYDATNSALKYALRVLP